MPGGARQSVKLILGFKPLSSSLRSSFSLQNGMATSRISLPLGNVSQTYAGDNFGSNSRGKIQQCSLSLDNGNWRSLASAGEEMLGAGVMKGSSATHFRCLSIFSRSSFNLSSTRLQSSVPFSSSFVPHISSPQETSTLSSDQIKKLKRRAVKAAAAAASLSSPATSSSSSPMPQPLSPLDRLRTQQILDDDTPLMPYLDPSAPFTFSRPSSKDKAPRQGSSGLSYSPSFQELGVSTEILAAIEALQLKDATEIQALGIPAVLRGEDVLLASHTGSGKTLAYLLPLVQLLRKDEAESGRATRPRRPRALVLLPTRELAEQVLSVAKSLCHYARFRSAVISGGCAMRPQQEVLNTPLDLVVGTPGRLLQHIKEGHMSYSDIKYVVLDEADTMFDAGFGPEVRRLLMPLRKRNSVQQEKLQQTQDEPPPVSAGPASFQTVLVTATITNAVQQLLNEEFPSLRPLKTSSLHKRVSSARHDFVPVSGSENKLDTLLQVVQPSAAKKEHVMVFCNTVPSCRAADYFLNDNGIVTANYHGEIPPDERTDNLKRFRTVSPKADTKRHEEDDEDEDDEGGNWLEARQHVQVLVCTDLAARGLDLTVDHVVMFDFPNNPIDYLHRTGRTARMGAKGKITSLVTKKDHLLSSQIEKAIAKGESLERLTKDRSELEARREFESNMKRKGREEQERLEMRRSPTFRSNRRDNDSRDGDTRSGSGSFSRGRGRGSGGIMVGRGGRGASRGVSRGPERSFGRSPPSGSRLAPGRERRSFREDEEKEGRKEGGRSGGGQGRTQWEKSGRGGREREEEGEGGLRARFGGGQRGRGGVAMRGAGGGPSQGRRGGRGR
eukprot:TRINITY_DN1486_c0_g2_i2.p1 TRINITY_DN1486_c0_g2~~TRINITY_DN1486_c0_g2_i2.p1  ORF type:complete len:840 (-),score=148.73 TRINITY_DN1486_c0_g2_i2:278-2797(-)